MKGEVVLSCATGEQVDLGQASAGSLLLCCFASCADELGEGGLLAALNEYFMELRLMCAEVLGISAELLEVLEDSLTGARLGFPVLCDEDLLAARALGAPTSPVGCGVGYKRMVVIARDGTVSWARNAAPSPRGVIADALAWLQENDRARPRAAVPLAHAKAGDLTPSDGEIVSSEGVRRVLGEVRRERERLAAAFQLAEGHLQALLSLPAGDAAVGGPRAIEGQLANLIVGHWTQMLRGPFDWAEWPLAVHTFETGFLDVAARLSAEGLQEVARVCALVASGRADRLCGLELRALTANSQAQSTGVQQWCCESRDDTFAAVGAVEYRLCDPGRIVFERLRVPS